MTLVIIVVAISLNFFLSGLERFRSYQWCAILYYSLEKRLAQYKFWDGIFGFLIVLSIRKKSYWVEELKRLLNRTLMIWLAILGVMTLSGTLS